MWFLETGGIVKTCTFIIPYFVYRNHFLLRIVYMVKTLSTKGGNFIFLSSYISIFIKNRLITAKIDKKLQKSTLKYTKCMFYSNRQ